MSLALKGFASAHLPKEVSAIEGLKRETLRLTRSRSRLLRQHTLEAAGGSCACCHQDFSTLQRTRLRAPLQVHHRRQLAADDLPRTTHARDLVTVCATGHTMIHSDPKRALPIASVRKLLSLMRPEGGVIRT